MEKGREVLFGNGSHPLLNSLVMSKVFEYMASTKCTMEEVRNYRSVCQVWHKESLKLWRSVAALRLGVPRQLRGKPYLSVREYIRMLENPERDTFQFGKRRFQEYVFCGVDFCAPAECLKVSFHKQGTGQSRQGNFWDLVGSNVKRIRFEGCKFHGKKPQIFEEVFIKKLVNLESLILKDNQMVTPGSPTRLIYYWNTANRRNRYSPRKLNLKTLELDGDIPMHIMHLMLDSPNLETLRIRNPIYGEDYCKMELFCHIRHKRDVLGVQSNPLKIKELDVMDSPTYFQDLTCGCGVSESLIFLHFNVLPETLSLTLVPPADFSSGCPIGKEHNVEDIHTVLTPLLVHMGPKLKKLKVFRPPIFRAYPGSFDPMVTLPHLEELHLWGNVTTNLNFLLSMRQLRVLYINNAAYDKAQLYKRLYFQKTPDSTKALFRKRFKPFKTELLAYTRSCSFGVGELPYLQDIHLEFSVSKFLVWALMQWAPNLKRLKASLSKAAFRAVCKLAKNLEELGVLAGNGVDDDALTGLNKMRSWRRANLTNLKKLKRFELKADCDQALLGNDAVHHGFLEMPSLRMVRICVSAEMSPESEELLRDRVPVVQITRNYGNNSHGDEECCRRKAFIQDYLSS